jgi:hypothetical protein
VVKVVLYPVNLAKEETLASINDKFPSLVDGKIPVNQVASVSSSAGFTRLANTTPYSAKDVMTDSAHQAMEFANISPVAGAAIDILNVILISSNPTTSPGAFALLLFDATQNLATDNSAYAPSDEDIAKIVGVINFDGVRYTENNTIYYPASFGHLYVKPAAGSTSLYGVLISTSAYTPASGEKFDIKLFGEMVR